MAIQPMYSDPQDAHVYGYCEHCGGELYDIGQECDCAPTKETHNKYDSRSSDAAERKNTMDIFRLIAPGKESDKQRGVVRVSPDTYARLVKLSTETGISMLRIVDQCVAFALERLEND